MKIWIRVAILSLVPIAVILAITALTGGSRAQAQSNPSTIFTVQVGPGISFSPTLQNIDVNDTIHWEWSSPLIPHSTTSGTCSGFICTPDGMWNSGIQTAPFTFDVAFSNSGIYPYFCSFHGSSMQGMIFVGLNNKLYLPLIVR